MRRRGDQTQLGGGSTGTDRGGRDFLYLRLARAIEARIASGALGPGERAPSVRALRRAHGVSVTTVLEAYRRLEDQGLLAARPRSGFYVRRPPAPALPEPRWKPAAGAPRAASGGALSIEIVRRAAAAADYPLGGVTLGPALLPERRLNDLFRRVLRERPDHGGRYNFPPGAEELRRQIARRSFAYGCALAPDDIVLTSGTAEALSLTLRALARAGDLIAVESPTHFGILQAVAAAGMRALEVSTHPRTGIDLELLERSLGRHPVEACVVMTTCHNPLGTVMPEARKRALVELLARRNVPLIEDAVYSDLVYDGHPPAAKAFDRDGRVILCASFSEVLAPGLRVGWLAAGRWRDEIERLQLLTTGGSPALQQLVVARFLATGGYDRYLRRLRAAIADRVQRTTAAIARHFPSGTRVARPAGGHLLWVELPGGARALPLYRRALARGVSLLPGPIFSAGGRFRRHVCLSCGEPWSERIDRGLCLLGELCGGADG